MRLNFTRDELELLTACVDYGYDYPINKGATAALDDMRSKLIDALARYSDAQERIEARNPKPKRERKAKA